MTSSIKYVSTDQAPTPRGHYSQATIYNGTIYVATQLGVCLDNPSSPTVGSIEEQTHICFQNVDNILKSVGSGLDKIVKVTLYISDISLWNHVNQIYIEIMGEHKPARGVIPVKDLHLGAQVAIDVIAAV